MQAQKTIPFTLSEHNNIIIKTIVNEKDTLDLMFQITMDDVALNPNRSKSASSIRFLNEISHNNTVKIGDITIGGMTFYNNELSGHHTDGKIGKKILKNQIFEIDYDNKFIKIHDSLPSTEKYTAFPLLVENGNFLIKTINIIDWEEQEMKFLLQSGFSGFIMYSNQTAIDHNFGEVLEITNQQEFQDSMGNKFISKQGILPYIHFGNIVFKDVNFGYFEGDARVQTYNYLGADFMKRFNWIFDVENEKVYVKASKYLQVLYYKPE